MIRNPDPRTRLRIEAPTREAAEAAAARLGLDLESPDLPHVWIGQGRRSWLIYVTLDRPNLPPAPLDVVDDDFDWNA
ncbi:hypothetical protein [Microvirga tunisiensis]|nr:hypothetical protein [Microvirga tunisiensis]MPR06181.1 hypothetical protein [Microvirga tunisiensis]